MKEKVKHFFVHTKGSPIRVSTAGISIWDKDQTYERKNPDMLIIEYVFRGEGFLRIDDKKIKVKTDDIYILPPGVSHEYTADSEKPWAKYFMNLSGNLAQTLLVNFNINNQYVFTASSLKNLFKEIMKTTFADIPESEKQSKLVGLYVEILHRLAQLSNVSQKSNEAVLLKNYLDENYHRNISNKELANHIYRSTDYCLKLFKREFGTTPYDYQINNKIQVARSLLQHTKKSVSEIAEFIGCQNPHYFASMFKTRVGITPTEYRKQFH